MILATADDAERPADTAGWDRFFELSAAHSRLQAIAEGAVDASDAQRQAARGALASEAWQQAAADLVLVAEAHDEMLRLAGAHPMVMDASAAWAQGLSATQVEELIVIFEAGAGAVDELGELASCRLPFDLTVWRGVPETADELLEAMGQGARRLTGGLSTSLDQETCWAYADRMRLATGPPPWRAPERSHGCMVRIDIPAGYPGCYLEAGLRQTDEVDVDAVEHYAEQFASNREWVIAPGGGLEVVDVQRGDDVDMLHLRVSE